MHKGLQAYRHKRHKDPKGIDVYRHKGATAYRATCTNALRTTGIKA